MKTLSLAQIKQLSVKSKQDAVNNVDALITAQKSITNELQHDLDQAQRSNAAKHTTDAIKKKLRAENLRYNRLCEYQTAINCDDKAASFNYFMQRNKQMDLQSVAIDAYSVEKLVTIACNRSIAYQLSNSTKTNHCALFSLVESRSDYNYSVGMFVKHYSDVKEQQALANGLDKAEAQEKREKTTRQTQMIVTLFVKLGALRLTNSYKPSNPQCTFTLCDDSILLSHVANKFKHLENLNVFVNSDK